jgi:hypothetical protein
MHAAAVFQSKNDVLNFFTSSVEIDFLYLSQIGSIIISRFLITFGLISIYGYNDKAFYYYEQRRIILGEIRNPEKVFFQNIGRFI